METKIVCSYQKVVTTSKKLSFHEQSQANKKKKHAKEKKEWTDLTLGMMGDRVEWRNVIKRTLVAPPLVCLDYGTEKEEKTTKKLIYL